MQPVRRREGPATTPRRDHESRGTGELESTLTSVHPYTRLAVNEQLSVWGILGYGTGELSLEVENGERWTTGTAMEMAAAGEEGGFELSVPMRSWCG